VIGRLAPGALALVCAAAALAAGPGYRFGAWSLGVGFRLLSWAAYGAIAAAIVAVVALIVAQRRGTRRAVAQAAIALVVAVATFAPPAMMLARADRVPSIHDITTDTDDPPRFVAVLGVRAGASNSAEYEGARIATLQRAAYPQVVPLDLDVSPDAAFQRALAAARDTGWTIVAVAPAEGRIEATDTTPFFGFKDDVVIRVRSAPRGSRIDVRSLSRIGGSNVGTNARRIEAYLARVRVLR
jgi:uncharacterized protein (DUF1499 family)